VAGNVRLARLILVMSLALYWAVSTGMGDQANHPIPVRYRPDDKLLAFLATL
jgi:hypothetical protein